MRSREQLILNYNDSIELYLSYSLSLCVHKEFKCQTVEDLKVIHMTEGRRLLSSGGDQAARRFQLENNCETSAIHHCSNIWYANGYKVLSLACLHRLMDTILVIALTGSVSNSPGLFNIFFVNIHTYSKQLLPHSSPSPRRIFAYVSPK